MNEQLINNWNKTVRPKDHVMHLGDFAHDKATKEFIESIVSRLNGKIHIVLGNNDNNHSLKWWYKRGFKSVYDHPIIFNKYFILSHEPQMLEANTVFANVHGHTHINKYTDPKNKIYYNVCVEQTNYTPINFDEIIETLRANGADK
jgi:calcineurin-like phosphoesterase family protein